MTSDLQLVLARVAEELASCAILSAEMESCVQDVIAGATQGRGATVSILAPAAQAARVRLQDLDRLTQSISDLSRFLAAVAPGLSGHSLKIEEALADMHLRDLQIRLAGEVQPFAPVQTGTMDLL